MPKHRSQKRIGREVFEVNILDGLADPVILIDEHRIFVDGNSAAFEIVGDDARGQDLADAIDSPQIVEAVDRVLQGEALQQGEAFIPSPVSRTYEIRVLDLSARNPNKAGWVMLVLHDVSSTKQAEKMRADFVSNVSHEMRSPLSTLLGFIETLRGPARDDLEAQERFLAIMEEEAKRMTRLINDLLALSKVEADEHIRPDMFIDIQKLLSEVVNILSVRANERDMCIKLNPALSLPMVVGDKDELVQVFRNLVDNAINYGTAGTTVQISAKCEEATPKAMISIAVTNQGEGIESKYLPRLTERFYRIDKGRSRATGGTGLGLAIVKHIVNRHRGRLEISSVSGESTIFTVFLPARD